MARRRCLEMYEQFRKEHELTRDQMRAEREAERERWRSELDARYERLLGELEASREEKGRGFASVSGAIANNPQVMREMLLDLREGREILKDIQSGMKDVRDGIRANTEGVLRVLDELRREDGPSPAGA